MSECKYCGLDNLVWLKNPTDSRWILQTAEGRTHKCSVDREEIRMVTCKYCRSPDLHWAEETMPYGKVKNVLTESYGLPHLCEERDKAIAAAKQAKKDKYAAIKARVEAAVGTKCEPCNGRGRISGSYTMCSNCYGYGEFKPHYIKSILGAVRRSIWPNRF